MQRRFITKQDIDAIADAGLTQLEVDRHATVTDIAVEHARERGVKIVRVSAEVAAPAEPAAADGNADLTAEVRAAVIARLGTEPADLDAILAKVLPG